jgi:phosphate transport system protein
MAEKYPRIRFRKRLKDLRKEVQKMGQATLLALKNSVDAFVDYDEELAKDAIKASKKINVMGYHLERECIRIIAAEQPVASDLRFIEAVIKVGAHLKRLGYLAANIARVAKNVKDEEIPSKPMKDLIHMADIVQLMASKGLYSFLDQNIDTAMELREEDDKVDELFDQALSHITKSMAEDKDAISYLVHLLFVARYMERVADHAVSIGDRTIIMVTSERP